MLAIARCKQILEWGFQNKSDFTKKKVIPNGWFVISLFQWNTLAYINCICVLGLLHMMNYPHTRWPLLQVLQECEGRKFNGESSVGPGLHESKK